MYCNKCGNELKDEEQFCSKCGIKIEKVKEDIKKSCEKEYEISKRTLKLSLISALIVTILSIILNNFIDCSISVSTFKDNRIAAHIFLKFGFKHTINRKMNIEYGKNVLTFPQSYFLLERK